MQKANSSILRRNDQLNQAAGPDTLIFSPSSCLTKVTIKQHKRKEKPTKTKKKTKKQKTGENSAEIEIFQQAGELSYAAEEGTQQMVRICNRRV